MIPLNVDNVPIPVDEIGLLEPFLRRMLLTGL